ncbi:MAG: hypothetical protein DWI00_18020 [Planctomycetota bacterium]|nr:MAG: hypothetical protein DWI00_18020 [Planctomycetota bacterium]
MDRFRHQKRFLLLSGAGFLLTGCGSTEPAPADADTALIDELLSSGGNSTAKLKEPAEPVYTEDNQTDHTQTVSRTRPADRRSGQSSARGDRLELRLQKGDRFPLVKTVHQTLNQRSEQAPALAETRLELTLVITVEEVRDDAILLGVRYSRVNYAHDVAGQQLAYDSSTHAGAVPWDAVPYAGMINNGFSFWLGRDNSIREMVGYKEFLERCVAEVPLERRETLLSEISNRFGDDGVANFVDDSIGLLPYDATVDPDAATRVLPGDVWTRERRLMQPVPVQLTSTYRLTGINDTTAEIDITGRIASGDAAALNTAGRLRISGGHSLGRCIVDRATGLPLEMNLTRYITMKLTTADEKEVVQEKTIVTTIRAFPETRGPVAVAPVSTPIQRVSGFNEPQNPQSSSSTQPNTGSRAVRAVYPE